ncbi:MAG: hypothetical protein ACFFB2_07470 [Promethearchaeota archaeon]
MNVIQMCSTRTDDKAVGLIHFESSTIYEKNFISYFCVLLAFTSILRVTVEEEHILNIETIANRLRPSELMNIITKN